MFVKKIYSLLFLFLAIGAVHAETVYVTDDVKLTLRSGPSMKNKIVKMLPSGTPLSVIKRTSNGYVKVKTPSGATGYILSRHTQKQPIHKLQLKKVSEELEQLRTEHLKLKTELETLKSKHTQIANSETELTQQKDKLSLELAEIQQTAANAILLKKQRDQLQERVVNAERELQQLKREKQTLEDSSNQSWFIYGGLLAFAGILFGLLIPRISWKKKPSNWDSF